VIMVWLGWLFGTVALWCWLLGDWCCRVGDPRFVRMIFGRLLNCWC